MKYIKLFNSESEYLTYKNSEDYITPNTSLDKLTKKVYFNKKLKPLFPCYLQTTYSTTYNESYFIRTHIYTVQLESSRLHDTLYNNLVLPDGYVFSFVPDEFLDENPIYIDGHRVSGITYEQNLWLYVSTNDSYPFSQYYDNSPGGVQGEYSILGTNQLKFEVELLELPDVVNYTTGDDISGIMNYLHNIYNEYLFSDEPVYFDEHYNENININGNKIYSVSYKERFAIYHMEFMHSTDIKYLYDGRTLIQDIIFPVELTSNEGSGLHRTISSNDETKKLLNYLDIFSNRVDSASTHYEFTANFVDPIITIDRVNIYNPVGHKADGKFQYIRFTDYGSFDVFLYPDGSITAEFAPA